MRVIFSVVLLLNIAPCWAGNLMIADGDTLVVNGITYQLDGIDAPETDQLCLDGSGSLWNCGIEAREQLKKHVGSREVRCEAKGWDIAYRKRRMAICSVVGETGTLNEWLVQGGWALNFEPYAKGRFKADEQIARDKKQGLWAGCFATPLAYRNSNRNTARLLGAACSTKKEREARDLLFPLNPAMPAGCSIKGKYAARARLTEHRGIYHVEGCGSYQRTKTPDRWFCSEQEAQAEGFRKSFTCKI